MQSIQYYMPFLIAALPILVVFVIAIFVIRRAQASHIKKIYAQMGQYTEWQKQIDARQLRSHELMEKTNLLLTEISQKLDKK